MKNISHKKYIISSILILIILSKVFLFLFTENNSSKNENLENTEILKKNISLKEAKITNIGFVKLKIADTNLELPLTPDATLYDTLLSAQKEGMISFSGKNYPGLGFFITEIESMRNENGKYLFYYINNQEASVGVSVYLPKDGDIIEWKLK
jgi:hypothetical protein